MEELYSKLRMENWCIMQQNEMLRKAAERLNKENQILFNELQQKLAAAVASASASASAVPGTSNKHNK